MTYKIFFAVGFLILALALGAYFIKPDLYDTSSVFYDRFYSGAGLEQRLEDREISTFPTTIGRLALYGPTERGIGVSVDKTCRFSDPLICSKLYRLEYRDFKGDLYFVNISKFKDSVTTEEIRNYLKDAAKSTDGDFYRFEQHEIGWVSEEQRAFLIIQKGVCTVVNNQPETCAYPNRILDSDEVVSVYSMLFPVSAMTGSGSGNKNTKQQESTVTKVPKSTQSLFDELSIDDYNLLPDNDNPKRIFFAVKNTELRGKRYVTFAANIWKEDGDKYLAAILFGDGKETTIAHWSPQIFSEETMHEYKKAGIYTSSLVLVPMSSVTEEVEEGKIKMASLSNLILIKKITLEVDANGVSTIVK